MVTHDINASYDEWVKSVGFPPRGEVAFIWDDTNSIFQDNIIYIKDRYRAERATKMFPSENNKLTLEAVKKLSNKVSLEESKNVLEVCS